MVNTIEIMAEYIAMRKGNSANAIADDGLIGKAFDCACHSYMAGRKTLRVQPQGKCDIRSKAFDGNASNCEFKSACGKIDDTFKKSCKYVIYCPDVDLSIEAEFQAYVFTQSEWLDMLNGYNGGQTTHKRDGHTYIQSFYVSKDKRPKASKKLADYIWECCNNQPLLADFYE